MTDEDIEPDSEPTSDEPGIARQTVGSLLMSVAFWSTLLVAAAMYSAVALSPKLAGWINAHQQYAGNAARLAELEDEADYLERLSAALKSDPAFAVQLLDATQGTSAQDTDSGPTSRNGLGTEPRANSPVVNSGIQPQLAGLVFDLATHEEHRKWLLIGSCGLTLLAFSLLNEAGAGVLLSMLSIISVAVRTTVGRYQSSPKAVTTISELPDPD